MWKNAILCENLWRRVIRGDRNRKKKKIKFRGYDWLEIASDDVRKLRAESHVF